MKNTFTILILAVLTLTVFSCSDSVTNSDADRASGLQDTLIIYDTVVIHDTLVVYDTLVFYDKLEFNDPDDATTIPDFRKLSFYMSEKKIMVAIELYDPLDLAHSSAILCFLYMYDTNHDVVNFEQHEFNIRRDNNQDGYFEELLTEGVISWSDSKTAYIVFDKSLLPDFYTKMVWVYSMASLDRMPNTGRFSIADSLFQY